MNIFVKIVLSNVTNAMRDLLDHDFVVDTFFFFFFNLNLSILILLELITINFLFGVLR